MSIKKLPEDNQKEPNFIGSWSVEENICKGLIDYFNKNNDIHHEGQTADGIDKENCVEDGQPVEFGQTIIILE